MPPYREDLEARARDAEARAALAERRAIETEMRAGRSVRTWTTANASATALVAALMYVGSIGTYRQVLDLLRFASPVPVCDCEIDRVQEDASVVPSDFDCTPLAGGAYKCSPHRLVEGYACTCVLGVGGGEYDCACATGVATEECGDAVDCTCPVDAECSCRVRSKCAVKR